MHTMKLEEFPPAVQHSLQAVEGWFELGNMPEALAELERVPQQFQREQCVINLRVHILMRQNEWDKALPYSEKLLKLSPGPEIICNHAYIIANCGALIGACQLLTDAADKFPEHALIRYNLACYCGRLGKINEAKYWLGEALNRQKELEDFALVDPDLRAVVEDIQRTFKGMT